MKKLLELTLTEKPLKSPPVVFSGVVELKKKRKYAECIVELYRHAGIFKRTIEVEEHEPFSFSKCLSSLFIFYV